MALYSLANFLFLVTDLRKKFHDPLGFSRIYKTVRLGSDKAETEKLSQYHLRAEY